MDHAETLALYDREMREGARPESPDARVERTGGVVRHVGGEGGWHGVLWSDLDAEGADAAIAEQVAYFSGLGREFEWKHHGHDRPVDLGQRLTDAGFTAEPTETLMIGETSDQLVDAV
ncbi:GNAT family N-acetyltransferase, partial [Streptomyces sp. NPDC002920]